MKGRIQTIPTVVLKDIFPDSKEISIKDLLKDIPTTAILTIVAHFMAQIHAKEDNFELQKEIILRWINQQSDSIRQDIIDRFDSLIDKLGAKINFFNNISSLYLYQELFKNYIDGDVRNLSADEELRIFKAYLTISTYWTEKEIKHLSQRPKSDDELVSYILPFQMTHNEIKGYKDFRAQLIKALYFFQFIEQDEELNPFLIEFLKQYPVESWEKYLMLTIIPYVMSLTGTKSTVLVFDSTNRIETDYWDTFCIQIKGYTPKLDFLELRETPVYKLKDYYYLFYNYNFIIDKLFQALQFVFSKILISKHVVESFSDFKSKYYSERFSENFLFYNIIKRCIENQKKIISFNGNDLALKLGYKGPDYYIRIDNNVILIEFKDILMGAGPKVSYDYKSIENEIHKKLITNESGSPKGVGQLASFINTFPKGGFSFDPIKEYIINIYPMLIVTDSAFTLFGINHLLEKELTSKIKPEYFKNIKHLGLLNFDTLVIFQDIFNENRIHFFDLLTGYDSDYKNVNSIYKFDSLDGYFIDYINYHNIPSRSTPKILKDFLQNEMLKEKK